MDAFDWFLTVGLAHLIGGILYMVWFMPPDGSAIALQVIFTSLVVTMAVAWLGFVVFKWWKL